jgi:hypothetical protein
MVRIICWAMFAKKTCDVNEKLRTTANPHRSQWTNEALRMKGMEVVVLCYNLAKFAKVEAAGSNPVSRS